MITPSSIVLDFSIFKINIIFFVVVVVVGVVVVVVVVVVFGKNYILVILGYCSFT